MAIDTIKSTAVLDGAIATADIADDAVTSAKLDTNIAVAGTFGVTGATTLNGNIVLVNEDTTLSGGEVLGKIEFKDNDGGSSAAGITSKMESLAIGDFGASALTFHTSTSGGGARTALTERFRIQHNGGVTFNGDTADANALDDYEEGTFTATLVATGSTFQYTYRTGSYTKIGNTVYFNLYIQLDGGGNSFVGNAVTISGLPFTADSAARNNFRFYVHGRYLNVDGANYYYVTANLANGSAGFSLNMAGDNVPNAALPATYLSSSSGQLFINGHYFVN